MIDYLIFLYYNLKRKYNFFKEYEKFHYISYINIIEKKLKRDKEIIKLMYNQGTIQQERHLKKIDELLFLIATMKSNFRNKDFENYKIQSKKFFKLFNVYHTIIY